MVWLKVSQADVATRLKCDEILVRYIITAESDGEMF